MRDTCDLYARSRTVVDGVPGPEGWELIASGIPYYHQQTDNIWQQGPTGEAVEPSILTTDHGHFPSAVPLTGTPGETRAMAIRNTTPDSPKNGWYAILGPATQVPVLGGPFNAGKQTVMLRAVDFIPQVDDTALSAGLLTRGVPQFTSVALSWLAATDGVGPYLYKVQYRATGLLDWTDATSWITDLAYTLTGLTPGQGYDVQIAVKDQLGDDDTSNVLSFTAPANLGATLTSPSNTFSSVSLSLAVTGGTQPYSIQFQYKASNSSTWLNFGSAGTATTATVSPLTGSTSYDFQAVITDATAAMLTTPPPTTSPLTVTTGVNPDDVGLVAEWRFNGDLTDSSGNGLNLSGTNGPTFVSGLVNQAMALDKSLSQYAGVADQTVLRAFRPGQTGASFCAWFKFTTLTGVVCFASKDNSFTTGREWFLGTTSGAAGSAIFQVYDASGNTLGTVTLAAGTLTTGVWYYFCWRWDQATNTIDLTVKHESGGTVTVTGSAVLTGTPNPGGISPFYVGSQAPAASFFVTGQVDVIRRYGVRITDAVLLSRYNAGLGKEG